MTKDCPKGVAAYRRRGVFALASAGAAMFYGTTLFRQPTPAAAITGTPTPVTAPAVIEHEVMGDAIATPSVTTGKLMVIPKRHP